MIIDYNKKTKRVSLRYRNEKNERVEKERSFEPYFYIEHGSHKDTHRIVTRTRYGEKPYNIRMEYGDWVNLDGRRLCRIYYGSPDARWNVKTYFENEGIKTYQADIDIRRLYALDELIEIPEYNLRKWYFDIETQVGGKHDGAVTVISLYDNYTEEYTVMTWFPFDHVKEEPRTIGSYVLQECANEEHLLRAFIDKMKNEDPDMILGWFIMGYDIPFIIRRMIYHGIDPQDMSPLGQIKDVHKKKNEDLEAAFRYDFKTERYFNSDQVIEGRLTVCLMDRFERLWIDSQMGTLPSLSLDYCSSRVLGEKKVVSQKFQGQEFYERGWLEDTQTYLDYAHIDVELTVKIDEVMNVSENQMALQRLIVCPFGNTYHNSQMGGMYFMRKAHWIPPTGIKGNKEKFEAAFVMDPDMYSTFGLHENVAIFDFKSLYPTMMASNNISWETKSTSGYPVWWDTPKSLADFEGEPDIYFDKDKVGLLPQAVLEMMKLRTEYKRLMKEATTEEDKRKWNSAQMATKRAVNAFYGILAKDGYGWGDMEMAKSITASARRAMRLTAFKAQELGYEVIYGHTDSVFIKVRDVDDAHELREKLDHYISREIFREPVELEFEKYAKKFFLTKKKNRYCGWLSWKDGDFLDEDKFFVMGFEMKKSNETPYAKEYQEKLLKMVSSFKEKKDIIDFCNDSYQLVRKGDAPMDKIIKRSRLRRDIEDYDAIAGGVAGIVYYNQQGYGTIEKGDSYYFMRINNHDLEEKCYLVNGESKEVNYIAFKKLDEAKQFDPNWEFIADAEVIRKSELIFSSLGWNIKEIKTDIYPQTLDGWW